MTKEEKLSGAFKVKKINKGTGRRDKRIFFFFFFEAFLHQAMCNCLVTLAGGNLIKLIERLSIKISADRNFNERNSKKIGG